MNFEVYCDEAFPDLFTSKKPRAQYLMIGSLWLPAELRTEAKRKIHDARKKHSVWGEIKWTKISPYQLPFYLEMIEIFMSFGMDMRFRCIAVDREKVDMSFHGNDGELGFYKFYYQVLHHWILNCNEYRIFCDIKTNRDPQRLQVLRKCLCNANLTSEITDIQSLPSGESVLIQLCDLLLGAASARLNNTLGTSPAKKKVLETLENHLNVNRLEATHKSQEKFNIFKIRLQGGW